MSAALPDWQDSIQAAEQQHAVAVHSIVLPLDGDDSSLGAVPVARQLVDLYHATLHVIYVGQKALDIESAANWLGVDAAFPRGTVFERGPGTPAEQTRRLMRQLPEPLLVISTALGKSEYQNRFGAVTESIFATMPERAVVVNSELDVKAWSLRQVLLAHDGTLVSAPATGPAADLAQRAHAEVTAVHVAARGEERPGTPGSIAAPLYVDQPQHEWPDWAQEFMNRVIAGGAPPSGVHFKLSVTAGQAGSELAKVARERHVDLVVMAWHGHWDHNDCATRVVIRNARCPVMLVYSAG